MDTLIEVRRQATVKAININPFNITLKRKKQVSDGAGGVKQEKPEQLESQTMRLYMVGGHIRDKSGEAGVVNTKGWGLLAEWNADVKEGDTFELGDQKFRVLDINPVRVRGSVVSLQIEIEELS